MLYLLSSYLHAIWPNFKGWFTLPNKISIYSFLNVMIAHTLVICAGLSSIMNWMASGNFIVSYSNYLKRFVFVCINCYKSWWLKKRFNFLAWYIYNKKMEIMIHEDIKFFFNGKRNAIQDMSSPKPFLAFLFWFSCFPMY